MRLTPKVRESFRVGKFEEFLDRAEDHLKARFLDPLPRTRDVSSGQWRSVVRDSYRMAGDMGRPSEILTVMIAKARIAFGWGMFGDIRFQPLAEAITELAGARVLDSDPVEDLLTRTEEFWTDNRLDERAGVYAALCAEFRKTGNWDRLTMFLAAREQTQGVYSDDAARAYLKESRDMAEALGLDAPHDQFRFAVLRDCYGAAFPDDPFHPEFMGCTKDQRTLAHALDRVVRPVTHASVGAER